MMSWLLALFIPTLIPTAEPPAPALPADAVVIASRAMLPALEPLLNHRRQQGHRFVWLEPHGSAAALRQAIAQIPDRDSLRFVLLVGDAGPVEASEFAAGRAPPMGGPVPAHGVPAVVNVRYGSEPRIASDHPYGDLDGDGLPELAVGRLPADTPQELATMVAKILAYERNADYGPWRQRINLVAGVGGFHPLVDTVIETATSKLLTYGVPAAYDVSLTYGSWRSPYCPDPRRFQETTLARHNEGCLFFVYVGHGQADQLDEVRIPGDRFPILHARDCRWLRCDAAPPIAILLACYTAAFDRPEDCLAEQMLKAPGGPVAVLGGSRVTMPYGMGVLGAALMEVYFKRRPATLGETIVHAKREMLLPRDDPQHPVPLSQALLDGVAGLISPSPADLPQERREHVYLFNLLGDPMLRMTHPQSVELTCSSRVTSGQRLRLEGRSELAGEAVLELVCRRDCHKVPLASRERFDPSDRALEAYQPVYEQTLDRCWARWALELPEGPFATEVVIPPECRGPCHLRLRVAGARSFALGAAHVYVTPASSASTSLPASASAPATDAPVGGR
jgi:hypothetical protein